MLVKIMNNIVCNLEAEKNLLSIAIVDTKSAPIIINDLISDDFSDKKNKYLFEALKSLDKKDMEVNLNNILAELENKKTLSIIGGIDYISYLVGEYTNSEGIEENIKILKNKTLIRKLFFKFKSFEDKYFKDNDNDDEFIDLMNTEFNELIQNRHINGFINLNEITDKVKTNIIKAKESGKKIFGIDTGFESLNNITNGLGKGEVWVIAARPGLGKTAFALNIAYNAAYKNKAPVLVYSLEMSPDSLTNRILANVSNVDSTKLLNGTINKKDEESINIAINQMNKVPLFIDNSRGITLGEIESKSTKFKLENPNLQFILIDYLGLIQLPGKFENERARVTQISHRIHNLAQNLEVPIILISQLNRKSEDRASKRPEMQDLRDSGDVEQDADKVILLYRKDYQSDGSIKAPNEYSSDDDNTIEELSSDASIVEVNVAKNRNGKTGLAYLLFFKNVSRFANPTKETVENYKKQNKNTTFK